MRSSVLFGRLTVAMILALGGGILWVWLGELALSLAFSTAGIYDDLRFRPDGTPFIRQTSFATGTVRFTDLAGQRIELPEREVELPLSRLASGANYQVRREPASWRERIELFSDSRRQPTWWYAVSDGQHDGRLYFEGYDSLTRLGVGYLSKIGFSTARPQAGEMFPVAADAAEGLNLWFASQQTMIYDASLANQTSAQNPFLGQLYLRGADRRLYHLDLLKRTVEVAWDEPNVESSTFYYSAPDSAAGGALQFWLVVRTDRQLALLDEQRKAVRRYTIPAEAANQAFSWGEITPGQAVLHWQDRHSPESNAQVRHLLWFDAQGNVARREAVNLQINASQESPVVFGAIMPCPALQALFWGGIVPAESLRSGKSERWTAALSSSLASGWPALLLAQVVGLLLAAGVYRRELRYATPAGERVLWTALVLLTGLPGWLGYRFSRHWPILEVCPHCRASVPRDRVECAHCRVDFPVPVALGCEVVSDADAVVV